MFDFIKNLFSSLTPEQAPTPKAVRQAQIKTMTISNESLKKDIGEDGLSKIISNVKYELYALYPDIRIDENLLKELVRSIAFAEPRSEAVLDTIQSVLPDLPKKTVMEYTGNISSLSSFHRDAVRSQKNGTEWYVWKPSCKVHQHMKEVFIRWDSPPSVELLQDGSPVAHHAGSQYGCYCLAYPILGEYSLREYKAPYKVCLNGKMIVKMKKKEFLEIYVDPMTVNLTRAYNRTKGNK